MFSPNGVSSTAFWYPWYYSIPTTITVVRWPLPFTEPFVDLFDALPNLITVPLLQKCKVGYFSSTVYWKNFCFLTYIFAFYSLIFKYSRERIKGKLPVIYLPWFVFLTFLMTPLLESSATLPPNPYEEGKWKKWNSQIFPPADLDQRKRLTECFT